MGAAACCGLLVLRELVLMSDKRLLPNLDIEDAKEREKHFQAIFNGAFEFLALLRPDGTLIEANQTALDYIGASMANVIGRPFWQTPWWSVSTEQSPASVSAVLREVRELPTLPQGD